MPQASFSTHEAVSLEKVIDCIRPVAAKPEELDQIYELKKCIDWIKSNNFQKVCLQFPDNLLVDSTQVALSLQNILGQRVYILGDTAYESCCIDYIAAAHINADAIIHFGPTCFSKPSAAIPYLYIYEKYPLDIKKLKTEVWEQFHGQTNVSLLVDTPYLHCLAEIQHEFNENSNISVHRLDEIHDVPATKVLVFIGSNQRKIVNIEFSLQPEEFHFFDKTLKKHEVSLSVLKKRNYLTEKIKDSSTIGIVVGTLGIKNYLKVIERLKKLIHLNGKKYYLISVGKPTVAKLANFPELDVYIVVTCSQSEIFENRDFYKPIATPYDVEIALNPTRNNLKFSYDFNQYLDKEIESDNLDNSEINRDADVSLLTNKIRSSEATDICQNQRSSNQIILRSDGTMSLNTSHGAGYLADRTWKGLEQNLGQTDVELAREGRSGLAQKYINEEI